VRSCAGDRVLELTSDEHYQRSPAKMFEVLVGDRNLVSFSWVVPLTEYFRPLTACGVRLPPAAHRADIHVIDVG